MPREASKSLQITVLQHKVMEQNYELSYLKTGQKLAVKRTSETDFTRGPN